MKKKINIDKILFYIVLIGFVLSIIPIFMLGKYSFPYYDDFNHGYLTFNAINNNKNILEVLKIAFDHTINIYNSWQGTYTAIFLSALHPGIFGEEWYFLTPIVIIFSQIFSTIYLNKIIFKDYLKLNVYKIGIISIFVLFFQIQSLPSAFEAYYWWASAIMHTFSYCLIVVFIGLILSNIKKHSFFKVGMVAVLSFIIGGGAYEIALFSSCSILFIVFIYILIQRLNNKRCDSKIVIELLIIFIISTIGLLINIAAPGNAIRIEESGIHVSPIVAILKSFIYSVVHTFEYISLKTVIVALVVIMCSYNSLKKIHLKLFNPIYCILLSWCAYSIIFTPAIYGENYVASPRYLNVLYFTFYWFLIIDVLYITYYYRNHITKLYEYIINKLESIPIISVGIILMISISAIFQFSYLDATFSCATVDILIGNAASFKSVNDARLEILNDESIKIAKLPKMNNKVRLFQSDDLNEDSDSYFNKMYARYYDKEKVIVIDEEK